MISISVFTWMAKMHNTKIHHKKLGGKTKHIELNTESQSQHKKQSGKKQHATVVRRPFRFASQENIVVFCLLAIHISLK